MSRYSVEGEFAAESRRLKVANEPKTVYGLICTRWDIYLLPRDQNLNIELPKKEILRKKIKNFSQKSKKKILKKEIFLPWADLKIYCHTKFP